MELSPHLEQRSSEYDIIVLGAGAAGLMAAATAGQKNCKVLLVDHASRLAEKIRISGGGRCNFTNQDIRPECYLSENPHFCRSALAQYTQHNFIALLKKHHVSWHEKKQGQLFCDDSSQQIIQMLQTECQTGNVAYLMQTDIQNVQYTAPYFQLQTNQGNFTSKALIISTGGLAAPQTGATPLGYQLAEQFGLSIIPPRPALVPLSLHEHDKKHFSQLSGISVQARVTLGKTTFTEKILFTHKGISGPAILQISSYWTPGQTISLDLLPNTHALDIFSENLNKKLSNILTEQGWSKRLAQTWLTQKGILDQSPHELSFKKRNEIAQALHSFTLTPNATLGYKFAEASRGGVDTRGLNSKTMASKTLPCLFFAGEVIDVTGWLGGYNFQWAWSSGYVAGLNATLI